MAADMFLKIDGIDGESHDAKHKSWIPIESWAWGEHQAGSASHGGGSGVGKVEMQDFSFAKFMDKSTPKLALFCANGKHIPTVEFIARKAGGDQQKYMQLKLSDVLISSFHTSNSNGSNSLPMEQVALNFSKVELEYFQQDAKGATASAGKMGWSVKENKAV
ncbi:MAG: type VI secretion system tube protein Hcp [Acidobacteria bacterium]|nr:type VI secretion system tube protein Hcp [Acidobacteriota bacterium]